MAEDEARADGVGEVAVRPQLDVVAEPGGLLMRVRVATQPREQRHVVDDRPLGLAELEVLGDAEAQHARSQHMLHRLPEAEVRRQRHRGHQLSQPNPGSGNRKIHEPSLTTEGERASSGRTGADAGSVD